MAEKFYLTTAIDYSNGDPHMGHALEKIGADAIARYHRLIGDEVHFLMGMDEHGKKVAQEAVARGFSPQAFVDGVADRFLDTWRRLDISYDQFIRTTDPAHGRGVRALLERIFARNPDDFYEREYQGWYCVGCELFKRDNEIVDGRCVLHSSRPLEWTTERNWFFRLTKYQPLLRRLFTERPDFLRPAIRRNATVALIEQGLEDISVTRSGPGWGIPFPRPLSTGEEQTTWVWFDALPNYLTATGFPDPAFADRWPAQLHVIGKDISRLHAIIWPAQLAAAGLPLPDGVWAHGFVHVGGTRLSKTAGVTVTLDDAISRHGPDALRYFLLREVPWDADGNFTWERFDGRYAAELADGWGNLLSRVLAMIVRYLDGVVPAASPHSALHTLGDEILGTYRTAMDNHLLHVGAAEVWRLVDRANRYVEERQPWTQAKQGDRAGLEETLGTLVAALARISVLLSPFLPRKADEAWHALGLDGPLLEAGWEAAQRPPTAGRTVAKPIPLFPKSESSSEAS